MSRFLVEDRREIAVRIELHSVTRVLQRRRSYAQRRMRGNSRWARQHFEDLEPNGWHVRQKKNPRKAPVSLENLQGHIALCRSIYNANRGGYGVLELDCGFNRIAPGGGQGIVNKQRNARAA